LCKEDPFRQVLVYSPSRSEIGILTTRRTVFEKENDTVHFPLLSSISAYSAIDGVLKPFEGLAFQVPDFIHLHVFDSQCLDKRSEHAL